MHIITLGLLLNIHNPWWHMPLLIALIGVWFAGNAYRRAASVDALVYAVSSWLMFFLAFLLVLMHWL